MTSSNRIGVSSFILSIMLTASMGQTVPSGLETDENEASITMGSADREFRRSFRSSRVRSFAQAEAFARIFGQKLSSTELNRIALPQSLRDQDQRLRHAALSLLAMREAAFGPDALTPVVQVLADGERVSKLLAIQVLEKHGGASPLPVRALIRCGFWDRDALARRQCEEAAVRVLTALPAKRDSVSRETLSHLAADLENFQREGLEAAEPLFSAALNERLKPHQKPTTATPVDTQYGLSEGDDRVAVFRGVSILKYLAVLILLLHGYYLVLMFLFPVYFFRIAYSPLPHLCLPYLLAPTLYRRFLRPSLAFLQKYESVVSVDAQDPYKLVDAAKSLSDDARTDLVERISKTIQVVESDKKRELFYILRRIDQDIATSIIDSIPDDPEITAARRMMSKIMELPEGPFRRASLQLSHQLKQATTVSADFYNVITRANDSYAVYMVDVNGHGLAASLQALQTALALRAATDWGFGRPRRELENADELIRKIDSRLYVTMSFLEIDIHEMKVRYASAGMPSVLLFSPSYSEPKRLTAAGVYVGAGYASYRPKPMEVEESIQAGDLIILCSDGILEARGKDGHVFGEAGLIATIKKVRNEEVEVITQTISDACDLHSGSRRPLDDQSIIVIRIIGESGPEDGRVDSTVVVGGMSILTDTELQVEASLRRTGDYVKTIDKFIEHHAIPFAAALLSSQRIDKCRIALRESMHNALLHGCQADGFVNIKISRTIKSGIEVTITQQMEWPEWDKLLGAARLREAKRRVQDRRDGKDVEMMLGGTVLIATYADEIMCVSKGRTLSLRFYEEES